MPDRDRESDSDRYLVCESSSCNPNLHDYDQVAERGGVFGDADTMKYVHEQAAMLKHTRHEATEKYEQFDSRMGWIREYRCTECGRIRRF